MTYWCKPLATLCFSALTCLLTGTAINNAQAQTLRVDPALLGLPSTKPVEPTNDRPASKAAVTESIPIPVPPAPADVSPRQCPLPKQETPIEESLPEAAKAPAPTSVSSPKQESAVAEAEAIPIPVPPTPVAVPPRQRPLPKQEMPEEESPPEAAKVPAPTPRPVPPPKQESAPTPAPMHAPTPEQAPAPIIRRSLPVATTALTTLRVDPALLVGVPDAPIAQNSRATPTEKTAPLTLANVDEQGATKSPAANRETAPTESSTEFVEFAESSSDLPQLSLKQARAMNSKPNESEAPKPTFLSAKRMDGTIDKEFIAEGEAELRKVGTLLNADRLTYWPVDDEVEAEGEVRLEQGADLVTGPKMRLRFDDKVGFFDEPSYTLKREPKSKGAQLTEADVASKIAIQNNQNSFEMRNLNSAPTYVASTSGVEYDASLSQATAVRGQADRIDFEGENQYQLANATFSTCQPGNDDWFVKSRSMHLDYDKEEGSGRDSTLYFLGKPIFYTPWLSFSLNNERKSGFLSPTYGTNSKTGVEFSLPYYWNIAPNMDATITPRLMGRRGMMLNTEVRRIDESLGGFYTSDAKADFLQSDSERDGDNRYNLSLQHTQTMAHGFSGSLNYNKVSDDHFFTDLGSGVSSTSTTQLLQQAILSYGGGGWWNATANFQQYQTLQPDPLNPVISPYKLLPQLTINARRPDIYKTDMSFMGQVTRFKHEDLDINGEKITTGPDATRTVLYPQIALPYVTPGWYVTPKVGLNVRHYALSGQVNREHESTSVTLPVFSIDSGMTFERKSRWFGNDYTQTLEPRLYYVNIPYKDQDAIPIFDSGLADFNFAQIFSENQFSGWDRVNNANQLTAAVTTRLLNPSTGNELMRAMIGQRAYFTKNKVALDSTISTIDEDKKWERSDILGAFSGQILPKVYADTALQYSTQESQVKRFSIGGRYQPEPGKVINAAYRYNRDLATPVDQIDISGQWPLWGRLHGVGRVNYSFKNDGANLSNTNQKGRMIESIAGLEYNGGCWVIRGVVQQLALTQDNVSTAFFIQLELNDFAKIGSNPLELLQRNIQGYRMVNQPAATGLGQ